MFSIKYRYILMILLGSYSFMNTLVIESFVHYPIPVSLGVIFGLMLVLTAAVWEGNRIWDLYVTKMGFDKLWVRILYNLGGGAVLTSMATILLGSVTAYLTMSSSWQSWLLPLKLLLMYTLRINLFLNTLHVIFLYHQRLEKSTQELETYKKLSAQAELQSLKNQINPHFLFNNLSVLSALIPMDANMSVDFVKKFSNVYRYVLKSHEKEITELTDELLFIEAYVYLLKIRFGKGLHVDIHISPEAENAYIIPMGLQLLIENAVKHNVVSASKPLRIKIFNPDLHAICVSNNLQAKAFDTVESHKMGLFNISKRYEFLGQRSIEINQDLESFRVSIPLIYLPYSEYNKAQP